MAKQAADRYDSPEEVIKSLTPWSRGADLAALLARARAADDNPPPPRLFREPRLAAATADDSDTHRAVVRSRLWQWAALVVVGCTIGLIGLAGRTLFDSSALVQRTGREAAAPSHDVDPFVRSREVAKWILGHPHAIAIVVVEGQRAIELKTGDTLPNAPFQLVAATLDGEAKLRDGDLAWFDGLPELTTLSLSGKRIGNPGLRKLGDLPALENLFLVNTNVGDAGLAELKWFPRLAVLQLYDTKVSDEGLQYLVEENKELGELSLVGCRITDQGLKTIAQLKQLKLLAVDRTGVTAAGVAGLHIALPDCEIRSDFATAEDAAEKQP